MLSPTMAKTKLFFFRRWSASKAIRKQWTSLAWLDFGRLPCRRLSQLTLPEPGLSQDEQHWRGEAPLQPARWAAVVALQTCQAQAK